MTDSLTDADTAGGGDAPVTPPVEDLPPIAAKANDLESLRAAVVDAAAVGAGLWISYVFVLLYLLVAAGSVTHTDLLFESPVRLPFLGVDLPLTAFFSLGPLMFLIVHAYVLLHIGILAAKVTAFDQALRAQIASIEVRTQLRRQLPSNIFVQYLAGPAEVRDGLIGLMLWLIALISLLLVFELQFLSYHDVAITWWQRVAVLIDIVLMWLFWPKIALLNRSVAVIDEAQLSRMARAQRGLTLACMIVLSVGSSVLMLMIATIPGEFLEVSIWPIDALRDVLVEGEVNPTTRKPVSLWSNRLILPGFDVPAHMKFDSEAKIAAAFETASFRGRHLEGAVLTGANLRKVDFTGADLRDALLDGADLREARLECGVLVPGDENVDDSAESRHFCAQLPGASLQGARLQGAFLHGAVLDGATLDDALLQNAKLGSASLNRATLRGSQLQGAAFDNAVLDGAVLDRARAQTAIFAGAKLRWASLSSTQLDGADLTGAALAGADLSAARLRAATLNGAGLEGANLHGAKLQVALLRDIRALGAVLLDARLQGAVLDGAQLQGATLSKTALDGASIRHIYAWRAEAQSGWLKNAWIEDVSTRPVVVCRKPRQTHAECDWTAETFNQLKALVGPVIPDPAHAKNWLDRIEATLDPGKTPEDEARQTQQWAALSASQPTADAYEAVVAGHWRQAGCEADGAPYVAAALLKRLVDGRESPFAADSAQPSRIAAAFLAETCQGARGLADAGLAALRGLAANGAATGTARQGQ